jgi:hypothetical protein
MNVFISHSSEDADWARKLTARLKRAGLKVWDASQVSAGDNWALEIGKALEKSDAMIVLISPASAKSLTVQKEIEYALTTERFQDRLIPVVVKPTSKFPWILHRMHMERGEPAEVSKRILSRLQSGLVSKERLNAPCRSRKNSLFLMPARIGSS